MNWVRCPICGAEIDTDELDELEPIVPDHIVGCGHMEDAYMPCGDCAYVYDGELCVEFRGENEYTLTRFADIERDEDE